MAIIPPTTTIASGRCVWAPIFVETAAGNSPKIAGSAAALAQRLWQRAAAFFSGKLLRQSVERRGSHPFARNRWIDIGEEAQDAVTIGGTRWECVRMQQIIALVQAEISAIFFEWTIAGVIQLPIRAIRREQD